MPLAALGPILAGAAGTSAAATAAAWGAIGTGVAAGTNLVGAKLQSNAARDAAAGQVGAADRAAQAQLEGQKNALDFTKQQAAYDANVAEANRHANYDQYVASRGKTNSVADLLGMPHEQIPGYVPLPAFPGAAGPNAAGPTTPGAPVAAAGAGPSAGSPGGSAEQLRALIAGGLDPQQAVARFNQQYGRTPGNEAKYYGAEVHGTPTIGLPDAYLSLEPNGWQVTPRAATAAAGRPPSALQVLNPSAPPYQALPVSPGLVLPTYRPQSAAAYLGM